MSVRTNLTQAALGTLLGAITAVLGTVFHQAWIQDFPYGLLVSFGLLFLVFIRLRRYKNRLGGWIATLVMSLLVFVFAQPGTDVMIPNNFQGITWSYGSIGLAVLVTAFPRVKF